MARPVTFLADPTAEEAVTATRRLPRGGVAVGENTRFYPGEESNDPTLAERFAALGDFYVNDAFGSAHRAHASTEAVARLLKPAVSGFLMQQELRYLGEALHQPKRPFVAVLGGAKISGKIDLIEALLPKVDAILLGGAMACTFFRAMGLETGKSLVEEDRRRPRPAAHVQGGRQAGAAGGRGDRPEARERHGDPARDPRRHPGRVGRVRHRSGHRARLRRADRRGGHGGLERADGRVRDATVRPRHARRGARDGRGHREAAP